MLSLKCRKPLLMSVENSIETIIVVLGSFIVVIPNLSPPPQASLCQSLGSCRMLHIIQLCNIDNIDEVM